MRENRCLIGTKLHSEGEEGFYFWDIYQKDDTHPRFIIRDIEGKITLRWGDGSKTPDTDLFRATAGETLKTNGSFIVGDDLKVENTTNIVTPLTDYAAGSGILTIHGDSAGQSNASYLIRGVRQADGDPEDHFLLFQDNSTGAAGNGDDMFKVDSGGDVTMEGNLTVNGDAIIGDGSTDFYGYTKKLEVSGGASHSVTAAKSGYVFYNDQACEFDLPADPTGLEYTFVVANASNLHVDPDGTDQILYTGCAAGDRILSASVGDTITLVGISSSIWYVKSVVAGDGDFTNSVWTDAD